MSAQSVSFTLLHLYRNVLQQHLQLVKLLPKLSCPICHQRRFMCAGSNPSQKPPPTVVTEVTLKTKSQLSNADKEKLKSKEKLTGVVLQTKPAAKQPKSENRMSNVLIGPVRAMQEFCLKAEHLTDLPRVRRRSPYHGETDKFYDQYLMTDVEAKAIQVHGSREAWERKRQIYSPIRKVSYVEREEGIRQEFAAPEGLWQGSGRVVLIAVAINGANCLCKLLGWYYTGSHSMFAEAVHSFADMSNQIILAVGIHQSTRRPDSEHPYGYSNMRYVTSLISGVGIFFFGTGLSFYHGCQGLLHPEPLEPFFWAFFILGGSLLSECATLIMAYTELKKKATQVNMTVRQFVYEADEPSLNVVLLEDLAAVFGVGIAATCMGLSSYLNSSMPDAIGSLVIGSLLAVVAGFIVHSNSSQLVGKSIPEVQKEQMIREMEADVMIRSIQDVKATELGYNSVRFKAEIDFDGRSITKAYLEGQDLQKMLEEVKSFETAAQLESFLMSHGDKVIDQLGWEVDRIEREMKKKHPEVRHVDVEPL